LISTRLTRKQKRWGAHSGRPHRVRFSSAKTSNRKALRYAPADAT
jgi:hypothetical protein